MKSIIFFTSNIISLYAGEAPLSSSLSSSLTAVQPKCLSEWTDLIIRPTESIKLGARYLQGLEQATQTVIFS